MNHGGPSDGNTKIYYSDPFLNPSNEYQPRTRHESLDLAVVLYKRVPVYGSVTERLVGHFVTDFKVMERESSDSDGSSAGDNAERKAFLRVLNKDLQVKKLMMQAGKNWAVYGNAFLLWCPGIRRLLKDTRSGKSRYWDVHQFPKDKVSYNSRTLTFTVPDPVELRKGVSVSEAKRVQLGFIDKFSSDPADAFVAFLDPRLVEIEKSPFSKEKRIAYRIPASLKGRVESGNYSDLLRTPKLILEAIANNKDVLFDSKHVFHFRNPEAEGMFDENWAQPLTIRHYPAIHQILIYKKSGEVTSLDQMRSVRTISPSSSTSGTSAGGPTEHINGRAWVADMKSLLAKHRKNPYGIYATPHPVQYGEFGGENRVRFTHEEEESATRILLDGLGYPQELFRSNLSYDQTPTAIRMMENVNWWLHDEFNDLLSWLSENINAMRTVEGMVAELVRPSIANSIEDRQRLAQLVASGEISRRMGYADSKISDPVQEAIARAEEDVAIQEGVTRVQAAAQLKAEAGSMATQVEQAVMQANEGQGGGGGAPAQGAQNFAPSSSDSMNDVMQRADEIARDIVQQGDERYSRQTMSNLRGANKQLADLVEVRVRELRDGAASEGRAQASQMV